VTLQEAYKGLKPPFVFGDPKQIMLVSVVELAESVVVESNALPLGATVDVDCPECHGEGECSHCGAECEACDVTVTILDSRVTNTDSLKMKDVAELQMMLAGIRAARGTVIQ